VDDFAAAMKTDEDESAREEHAADLAQRSPELEIVEMNQ
jgi:hypothetical protein